MAAPPAKVTKAPVPRSSLTDVPDAALRHTLRFACARTLAVVECVTPRLGRVGRAAVVELAAFRFRITVEPVPGGAWRLLVQEGLAGVGCEGVAARENHGVLVDRDGRARSWGDGRLGHGSPEESRARPQTIASLATQRVVCCAVGSRFSMVLTAAGTLYSFGENDFGQLGLGHNNDVDVPMQVAIGPVSSVCAGNCHVVAITRTGNLWAWGCNVHGELGHGDGANR